MPQPFKCLNPKNAPEALRAYIKLFKVRKQDQYRYRCSFFNDQLWIKEMIKEALWLVADGDGPDSVDGYRFIQM